MVIFHVFLVLPISGIDAPHAELVAQHLFFGFFNGRGLVTLFFVLSGCVLALSLNRAPSFGIRTLPGYWVRRGFRLYSLLILAATLGALLQVNIGTGAIPSASDWVNR